MIGTTTLRKEVKSAKFNVTLPKDTILDIMVDDNERIWAEHPTTKNVWICVSPMNMYNTKWK